LEKRLVIAERTITGDPLAAKPLAGQQGLEQLEREFLLGFERRVLGDTALLSALFELRLKPTLWQVKPAVQKRVAFGAGVADENA
jgi:hypothetical protein